LYGKPITGEPPAKKVTLDVNEIVVQQVHTFEKPPKSVPGKGSRVSRVFIRFLKLRSV
jgi:hypothetical protein